MKKELSNVSNYCLTLPLLIKFIAMKKFALIAFLMLLTVSAFAQKRVSFGVYVNGAIPMGDLGAGDKIKHGDIRDYALMSEDGRQGYADIGGALGFDMTVYTAKGIGVTLGFDIFGNTNKDEIKDAFEDIKDGYEELLGVSYKYKLPFITNIPVFLGFNWVQDYDKNFSFYAEAATGPNFRLINDGKTELRYDDVTDDVITTYKYKTATTLGFKFGAGVLMWNRMSIVLDYYSLGSAKIEGTVTQKVGSHPDDYSFKGKKAMSASELVLRVGYHF